MFTSEEVSFMKKIGLSIDPLNISDEEYVDIEEKVSSHLQADGLDENYNPTIDGKMCEEILDKL